MSSNSIRNWLIAAFALFACAWAAPASAACAGGTCFVVAAGGNSATNTTWTLTSNGATCSCTPGATDAVILDSAAGQLTISGSFSVGTLDATGTGGSGSPYTSTVTHTANTIQINTAAANSFKLVPGMGWTSGASNAVTITFANTSGSAHITSAGKNFAAIVLNGVGGTVVQDDDLNITNATSNGTLTITNGIWDANGHATTASNFVSTGAASRTFKLGTLLKIGGKTTNTSTILNTTATLTLDVTSAGTLEIAPTTTAIQSLTMVGSALIWPALVFDTNTNPHNINITGNNTWTSWTVGPGWDITLPGSGTQTISGAFTVNGSLASPSYIANVNNSTVTTLAVTGACTGTYAILYGLTFTTCVPAFTQTVSFGGMTLNGGTITAPAATGGFVGIIGGS